MVTVYVPAPVLPRAYAPLPKAFLLREGKAGNSTLQDLSQKKCQPGEESLINMFLQSPAFSCPLSKKEELDQNDVPLSRCSSAS